MQQTAHDERRAHPRAPIVRTCKVRPAGALRFDGGTSDDASWSGMLLTLRSQRRFVEGDRIEVVVAWEGEAISKGPIAKARVRRVHTSNVGAQRLAVEFERGAEARMSEDVAAA